MKHSSNILLIGLILVVSQHANFAVAQLSFQKPPINYSKTQAQDRVAALAQKINRGACSLQHDSKTGYLASLLLELNIPVTSQTLVFSKTSLQRHLISSKNPRAIYFNDDTYVGFVPHGELIEIASMDPMLGTIFYTIQQPSAKQPGILSRQNDRCLFCHASTDTGRVPGLLMQSVYTSSLGDRVFPAQSIRSHSRGPLSGRWAGWFVTGTHGSQQHLGNLMITSDDNVKPGDLMEFANTTDLSRWFDVNRYLSPHSDLVALLLLQHQVSMHNLLTDANHRSRLLIPHSSNANSNTNSEDDAPLQRLTDETIVRLDQLAERVVDGLLMVGQIRFSEPVSGSSEFATEFEELGPFDSGGRSLRELDLRDTIFRYPCSYLIYTDSFDSLPQPLLDAVKQRLMDVLGGKDDRDKYDHLSGPARSAILQILRETKPTF